MLRCIISHGGSKFHTSFGEVVGVVGQNICLIYLISELFRAKFLKCSKMEIKQLIYS